MILILINGEPLDLPVGFSIQMEDTNPIFNDRGSQTIPATVPATDKNRRLLGFADRLDNISSAPISAVLESGSYRREGKLNITGCTSEGFSFNLGFDNSVAYEKWQGKQLKDLSGLPTFAPADGTGRENLMAQLYGIYNACDSQIQPLAVFPIAVNNANHGEGASNKIYWEFLNVPFENTLNQPTVVRRVDNNELRDVTVPQGYGVSPFVRVWKMLELIFSDLGLEVCSNPFKDDKTLARLVVLNNAADACCRGVVDYRDLLPDCTVQEFLNSLWVRFGMVYNINGRAGTVSVDLIKDIINQPSVVDITNTQIGSKEINYLTPRYIKLSAKTSLEGAAPPAERLEDFAQGSNLSTIRMGADVKRWSFRGGNDGGWDGDVADSSPDDDPWSDYDPGDDIPDYRETEAEPVAMMATQSSGADNPGTELAREFVTGNWYRLDATNGKPKNGGSGFFNWDPAPYGAEAIELASDDECVPVGYANNYDTNSGNRFSGKLPLYLVGARHYHSYIAGDELTERDGESTPLAFMFAYNLNGGGTIGRLTPEGEDGMPINLRDTAVAKGSLYFNFKDGLYNTYWRAYDEILRNGVKEASTSVRVPRWQMETMNLLDVYQTDGVRCLLDRVEYSLPGQSVVIADLTLRTAQRGRDYSDVDLGLPPISAAARRLQWRLLAENFGSNLDTLEVRTQGAQKFIAGTGYVAHGVADDYFRVGNDCLRFAGIVRATSWERDATIPVPVDIANKLTRTYKARIKYDVYEAHDTLCDDGTEETLYSATPIGAVTVDVTYTVVIAPKWVMC